MKFDIWGTASTLYPHARRKWDRHIFKWVQAAMGGPKRMPNYDETDILSIVAEVYADLEKIEVREGSSERSVAALVRKVAKCRAWKTRRRLRDEGYHGTWQPLGERHPAGKDNVSREVPVIGTTTDGSDDEAADPLSEDSWGGLVAGDPAAPHYGRQEAPVELALAEVAKKYGLTLEEANFVLSPERKSVRDRKRLQRIRERMKNNYSGKMKINGQNLSQKAPKPAIE